MGRRDTVPTVRRAMVQHRRPARQYLVRVLRRAVVVKGFFSVPRFSLVSAIRIAGNSGSFNGCTEKVGKNIGPLVIVFNNNIKRDKGYLGGKCGGSITGIWNYFLHQENPNRH